MNNPRGQQLAHGDATLLRMDPVEAELCFADAQVAESLQAFAARGGKQIEELADGLVGDNTNKGTKNY